MLSCEMEHCWNSLKGHKDISFRTNYIIVGDFNTMIHQNEKRGGSLVRDPHQEATEDLVNSLNWINIKPLKLKYTWNNRRTNPGDIATHMDRFLILDNLPSSELRFQSSILLWNGSDHRRIMLKINTLKNCGPIPFRFSTLWIHNTRFCEANSSWN